MIIRPPKRKKKRKGVRPLKELSLGQKARLVRDYNKIGLNKTAAKYRLSIKDVQYVVGLTE